MKGIRHFLRDFTATAVREHLRSAIEATVYAGPNAARDWCAAVDQSWDSLTVEIEYLRDADDRVYGVGRVRGHGRESGVAIDTDAACIAQFHDGMIAKLKISTDVVGTFEAAGLRE